MYLVDQGISPVSLNGTLTGLKFYPEITVGDTERIGSPQSASVLRLVSQSAPRVSWP